VWGERARELEADFTRLALSRLDSPHQNLQAKIVFRTPSMLRIVKRDDTGWNEVGLSGSLGALPPYESYGKEGV
jgi:hypothetical protein